jgi:aldehyde dehydrogenase (NAD+)
MTTVAEIFQTMEYGPAPESDAEARRWLASHRDQQFVPFIDGVWTHPGTTFEVIDPSTAAVLARVTQGTKSDVDGAAARRALPA